MGVSLLHHFQKIEEPIVALRQAYREGELTLYLGAGASVASGIPTWERLIQAMYFRNIQNEKFYKIKPFPNYLFAISEWLLSKYGKSLEVEVRKIKAHYSDDQFHNLLKEILYSGFMNPHHLQDSINSSEIFPQKITEGNPTMRAIVELCKNSKPRAYGLESIITYNYDNLLEQSLKQIEFKSFSSIWRPDQRFSSDQIPIFHVHGFIPFEGDGSHPGDIVLSEEHYNKMAHDAYFWGNMIQMQYLGNSVGLMIGLSLTDRNIRRLLDAIRQSPLPCQNFILLKEPENYKLTNSDINQIDESAKKYHNKFVSSGSTIKEAKSIRVELINILNDIHYIEKADTENILKELRVKPIWYKNHKEIPELLGEITREEPRTY